MKKITINNLEPFDNPDLYNSPINIPKNNLEKFYNHLKIMTKIRFVEEIISDNIRNGIIKCPCHLSNGQEAIPVSLSHYLNKTDYIFGNHRSHGHYIACGGSSYELFAEILGKSTGCAKGMGGSMHICSPENGFVGSVPIVAGTIPVAVGAALAAKTNKKRAIAVSFFGDGATEEGSFHESLNLASKLKLPILFICENNLFSSHLHILERQPQNATSRFANANSIESFIEDGNDLVALDKIFKKIIPEMRNNNRPVFVEAVTYRLKGHVGHDENIDVGLNRSKELEKWKKRDPIKRTLKGLIQIDSTYEKIYKRYIEELKDQLLKNWNRAVRDPFPKKNQILNSVFYK